MAQDPWAVVSTTPAPPPTATKQPPSDPWAVVDAKPVEAPVASEKAPPAPNANLSTIEDNPADPKTGQGEGTYAIKINGQVKHVPFSKVPHVAAIAPSGAYGHTTFANEEDERKFYKDLGVLPADKRSEMYKASSDQWHPTSAEPAPAKPPEKAFEPTWWGAIKETAGNVADIFLGPSGPTAVPGLSHMVKGTELDPQMMLEKQAEDGDPQAIQTVGLQQEIAKTFQAPLANVSETATFKKVFDPQSKSKVSRGITGFTKSVEGMTSLENIYSLASIYVAPEAISKPMGLRFQADIATSGVEGVSGAAEATAKGDEGAGAEAWGGMLGNVATIVAMHYGEHAIRSGVDSFHQRDNTAILNDKSQKAYEKDFASLTDQQKASVLYEAVEDAEPKFKERVTREVERLRQKNKVAPRFTHGEGTDSEGRPLLKKVGIDPRAVKAGVEAAAPTTEEIRQERLEAAKKLTRQIVERKSREAAYRHQRMTKEAEARRAIEDAEAARRVEASLRHAEEARQRADEVQPLEEQRGFQVEESRTAENLPVTGVHRTTERESGERYQPEPGEPAIPITERRTAAGEPVPERTAKVVADEARVQELSEDQFGQSFSALPVYRQQVAAEWLAKNHPEQWEAFKSTPAYRQHEIDVRHAAQADASMKQYLDRTDHGEQEALDPNADIHSGTAKLIIGRTNIDSVLSSDPETARDLNEHTERFFGKSFDSLPPENRVPALAEYLRTKPEKVHAFLTVDILDRMRTGQHIDIANRDAEALAKERVDLRMSQRDSIRRAMDTDLATKLVTEERSAHEKELSDALYASLTGRAPTLETVYKVSQGLTEQAARMGFGQVATLEDLFRIEREAKSLPANVRTAAVNEFLTRMRQVRVAAENHILQELAEATASKFRVDADGAQEYAARSVAHLIGQAADLQQAADDLRSQGQTAAADAAQQAADFNARKADAVVAGAESIQNPAPAPQPKFSGPIAAGRETRVVSPSNPAGLPAHYAVVEATDPHTSHMPFTYEKRGGYNQNGQPRDYSVNKPAQAAVESRAKNLDMDQVLSSGVTTMEGPSIIDQRGHVISGNGRMLSLLTALRDNPAEFGKYLAELRTRAASFGIDPAAVMGFKNPVLVKILDEPIDSDVQWSLLGTELNRDPTMGMSESETGVAMARILSPEYIERLSGIVDSLPLIDRDGRAMTVREALRARSTEIAQLMSDAGIISPNKKTEFLDNEGNLNEKSKALFENMMAGLTVTDPAVLERAPDSIKDKLARAGLYFIRMRNAGENWNLASMNTDAVRLFTRAQDASARLSALLGVKDAAAKGATGGTSLMERYLHPERFYDPSGRSAELSFDGQPLVPPQHPAVEALAMALDESPRNFASMLAKYANRAEGMQATMFGAEHPADAFTTEVASEYGLKVIPEEWGMVAGLPETTKAAIEDSRGPLPVEPSVHAETTIAAVEPDSSSVTDLVTEGPRTVGELRVALVNHPNIEVEMADSLTELFENILPRAIGEDLGTLLGNRRLTVAVGGVDGKARGYTDMIDDGRAIVRLCDSADPSTFLHEMAHYIRRYLRPDDQAVANNFVGAKPGEEWTEGQEEQFAQAFERYHFDGGIRRGKLEQVFAKIHRAMQSIYNAATGGKLAKGTKELNQMFDNWYDWTRSERKPITARIDVDQLADAANKVEIPVDARKVDGSRAPVSDKAQNFVFLDEDAAHEFLKNKKNAVKAWEIHKVRGDDQVYVRADAKKTKKLYQPGLNETIELARKAKDLEAQLKREQDPRRQAWLRGQLNGIEDKLRGSTYVFGGTSEPKDASVIQLVHGLGETPTMNEPTTPVQAVTEQQIHGDPTAIEIGGQGGQRKVPDESARVQEPGEAGRVPEQPRAADREHAPAAGKGGAIAKPAKNPLHDVKAARVKAPERARGTPVVEPDKWREHVEALGLPAGTPPPTIRIDPDIRDLMIYPGQSEAIEGALSALQQYDATVLAAPTGAGKTWMLSAIANHLLGTGGDKVGLIVTRSRNLIHEADGYVDTARRVGVDVDDIPTNMAELQTGMYAATYAQIRGNRAMFAVPWDFVLFDEAAEARNWTDSEQGKSVVMLGHAAKKVVYSSATPYSTVMELGYMHKLDLWPKGGFTEWAGQFGLREVGPNTYSGGTSAKKLEKLRQQLIERGQWQTLYKDMDGVEGHVALVPQTDDVRAGVRSIRQAFAKAAAAFQRAGMSRYLTPTMGHEAIYLKRYIEGARLPQTIDLAKRAVESGWRPVIFTEYRSPADEGMDFFHNLPGEEGAQINAMLPPLPDVVGELRKEFGNKIAIFAGEHNQIRAGELEDFQSGDRDAIYMTYAAGAVGANAQDKVGDKPRMGIFLGLPWSGIMFEQGTGRTWRYGTKSNVANVFMTSDTLPEMKVLATKILPRMRSLKAAVYGEKMESSLSRSLRESVGIPEELLEYDQGEEVRPQAAEFEQDGDGAAYTHFDDLELPDAKKAMNKGMKYKGKGRLYQGPVDRRVNFAQRKRVSEMSPEEMRKALLTSDVTGLPNARSFDEAERDRPAEAVAMSDADGLKAFNDTFGYAAGNELLKAKATALREAGVEAYHEKGDEFIYRGKSVEDLKAGLEKAREILRNKTFDVTLDDGRKLTLKGVDFSYGTGENLEDAETGLHKHKAEREAAGERKRGELGAITAVEGESEEYPRTERREAALAGTRLYQGPKDEDPWQRAAQDAWQDLLGRTAEMPAPQAQAIAANEGIIKRTAAEAGRKAMGSGEPVKEAVKRATFDMSNDALIWMDNVKGNSRAAAHFVKSNAWMFAMAGDRAVEHIFMDSGLAKEGAEMKRRMIDYDIRSGNYRGEFGGMVAKIIGENKLTPPDHELVTKIIEGKGSSEDPRINKAVAEYRKFFAHVRKRLADSGLSVVIYEDGKRKEVPFSKIEEDPHYWPHIYDWNRKFVVTDTDGKRIVVNLGDIMHMPKGSERRERLIDQVAKQRGISKLQAQAFFDKSNSGIRLAGNIERTRQFDIPMYGRDRQAIERYVNEVAEKLAATEIHGQFRQKTDALIDKLPNERERKLASHIITADLQPARLHDSDRVALRWVNRWLVVSKMSLSTLKLPFHLAKTSLATNTRSVARALLMGVTNPVELRRNAVDCGAMVQYIRQAWMREYGMKTGGIDQKMLDFNGFTATMYISRAIAAGAGRLWFEKYAYPELVKNPKNPVLRRKLTDLYAFTDEQLDGIAKSGYGPQDVKRMELGAANWTTTSGRPTELPPALRGTTGEPLYDRLTTLMRISQSLHGFMFKTASLVNRTVWQELYKSDWRSAAPYQLIGRVSVNFGLAGAALSEILYLRHKMSGSPEAEIEKRRREWLAAHPVSSEALFTFMSDLSMGMGLEVLTQFFNELATHDPKDKQKLVQQNRTLNAVTEMFVGVAGSDAYNLLKAVNDYRTTFEDTGKHKESPEERRSNIIKYLTNEEWPISRYFVKPQRVTPTHHGHTHRAASSLR